jgi:hypothetical protein
MASYGVGSSFGGNPYRVSGVPSLGNMNKYGKLPSSFKNVSKDEFNRLTSANRFDDMGNARMGITSPQISNIGMAEDEGMNASGLLGDLKGGIAKGGRGLRNLLSGESGAAVGGIAQGAASVLNSYMDRKTERERMKEEQRRRRLEEENNARIQALLMPLVQQSVDSARRRTP